MVDFEPSPRSSKRRRTGTYAARRTTLSGAEADPSKNEKPEAGHEHERVSPSSRPTLAQDVGPTTMHPRPESLQEAGNTGEPLQGKRRTSVRRGSHANEQGVLENASAGRTDDGSDGEEKIPDQEQEAETPSQTAVIANTQTRSSGRTRRAPQRFAVEEDDSTSVDVAASRRSSRTQIATRIPSPGLQQPMQSPQPKGILTPSRKGRRTGPRKSVVFDGDNGDKRIEEQLGFKDINSSNKKKGNRAAKATLVEQKTPSRFVDAARVDAERATTPIDAETDEDPLFDTTPDVDEILMQPATPASTINKEEDSEHVIRIKGEILRRLTNNSLSPVAHLEKEYTTLHTLLSATITAGESNSLLLLGSRGSGKSLLVEHALQDLLHQHANDFHIVRLSGFFQTDDKLALREIWRQLGREMAVSEDETGEVSSYADTMASLLSLLSHPEEFDPTDVDAMEIDGVSHPQAADKKTSKSVIFILDEFDLFTFHPRQTLLYNLFDIAQAKKAPIAVVGCSTRMDVVDLLEKRVKSRFSHRWLHVASMKSLVAFEDAVRAILSLPTEGSGALGLSMSELEWRARWNAFIRDRFLSTTPIQSLVKKTFCTTKSIPDLLGALYIPIVTLDLSEDGQDCDSNSTNNNFASVSMQPSLFALLPQLPTLHLALLVAGTRLETIHNLTTVNFALVYSHYSELLARSKLQRSASSTLASGGAFTGAGLRLWSKDTARGAWEDLAAWEAVVPVAGLGGNSTSVGKLGDEGLGSDAGGNRMFRLDVTLDEVAWAIKQKMGTVGAGNVLTRWCKEV